MEIRLATTEDIEGIRALMRKYHRDTISDEDRPDGFVTTAITDEQLTELIEKEKGVTIIAEPVGGSLTKCWASALRLRGSSGRHGHFSGT